MSTPTAETLLQAAERGEKLTTRDRRLVVAYLMATQPDRTNVSIADTLQVSEKLIRLDKRFVRNERAKLVKEDDISLVIADVTMSFENQVADIESSKKKCKSGTRDYLDHCKSIFDMQLKKIKALQDLGYLPRNLGTMTMEKFEYKAIVTKDGSVSTRPVDMKFDDDDEVIDVEVVQPLLLEEAKADVAENEEDS